MKIFAIAAASALIATQAFAGSYETRCKTETVPYQEVVKGGTPGEVIGGAIIGGLLGKAATGEDGGAAVGAIIGGAVANENSSRTVTKFREVETCTNVFIPARITDKAQLERVLKQLNDGQSVSREMIMDVQYTIGVAYDGKWGPMSRRTAEEYLATMAPEAPAAGDALFSLVVNDVVIVSSTDVAAIDAIKEALYEAGVDSRIFVDLQ